MIDKKAFYSLSYGLYIITTQAEGKAAGCVVNTFAQVTSTPAQVSVAINKDNFTTGAIRKAGHFAATVLSQQAPMELIGAFGFHSSADYDKFADWDVARDQSGMPYVATAACARFSARVVQEIDLGSHILFIGEVQECEALSADEPMTYAYYHQVKGGKTPPKASSYNDGQQVAPAAIAAAATQEPAAGSGDKPRYAWRCTICGHIEYVDELPDDFTCPLCGMGKEMFERVEVPAA